jgi:hypothetical protein
MDEITFDNLYFSDELDMDEITFDNLYFSDEEMKDEVKEEKKSEEPKHEEKDHDEVKGGEKSESEKEVEKESKEVEHDEVPEVKEDKKSEEPKHEEKDHDETDPEIKNEKPDNDGKDGERMKEETTETTVVKDGTATNVDKKPAENTFDENEKKVEKSEVDETKDKKSEDTLHDVYQCPKTKKWFIKDDVTKTPYETKEDAESVVIKMHDESKDEETKKVNDPIEARVKFAEDKANLIKELNKENDKNSLLAEARENNKKFK